MLTIETVALFAIFCALLTAVACFITWRRVESAVAYAQAAAEWCQANNSEAVAKAEIAKLSNELNDLAESYSQLLAGHRKLRSRVTMREVRAAKKNGDVPPDDIETDSAADKDALRYQLRKDGLLK